MYQKKINLNMENMSCFANTKACVSKFLGKQELTDLYLILIVALVSEMKASKVFIKKALKKETNSAAFISEIH